jgi:hypothetical protein
MKKVILDITYLPKEKGFKPTKYYFGKKWITDKCYIGCHYVYNRGSGICILAFLPKGIDVKGLGPNNCEYKFHSIDFEKETITIIKK